MASRIALWGRGHGGGHKCRCAVAGEKARHRREGLGRRIHGIVSLHTVNVNVYKAGEDGTAGRVQDRVRRLYTALVWLWG